jgi:hypothetical protein
VVITRCSFYNNHYSIYLQRGGSAWYIADNIIIGDTPAASESLSGEGIELNTTSGHTVAHNIISNVGDGVSYPAANVDIFGNDIFDTSDDGIEADNGGANVRLWGNRIHNAVHNGISFQPQAGGPWYVVRNQIVGSQEGPFKFRTTDRFVLLHNTIVNWGGSNDLICCNAGHLLRAFSRNNLWISARGGRIVDFDVSVRDWRTDIDYDGFDWGTASTAFEYDGWAYPDVWSFSNASGLERHGVRVSKDSCFEDFRVPGPSPTPVPPHTMTLQPGCAAVDAGAVLPNINDGFTGGAPDLGAHERGLAAAVYGPRPEVIPNAAPVIHVVSPAPAGTFLAPAAIIVTANATDEDGAVTRVEFFANGTPIGVRTAAPWSFAWMNVAAGNYTITAQATDDRGGLTVSTSVSIVVTAPASAPGVGADVVLYAKNATIGGGWTVTSDPSAAGGARLQNPNANAAKISTPLASPTRYFEMTFNAEGGVGYRLWMRGKATSDHWANDSVYVQFDRSVDQGGQPQYRIGTTSAAAYTLEDCVNCGLSNWGWQDNGFGAGVLGPLVYFAASGPQRIRVQVREDGLAIDQIVLSSDGYLATAPGAVKNDVTILPAAVPMRRSEVVLYARNASVIGGGWTITSDATAAGGARLQNANAGAAKIAAPLASPSRYFEMTFNADRGIGYRLWMRGKATANNWANDSVFVQFDASVDQGGSPLYRIGTTAATTYTLEDCISCGLAGWGWQDNGFGAGVLGPLVYFANSGPQRIRVQVREDGLAIDQIVLSAERFLQSSPGAVKNDVVIVPEY